jgi:hypothetical protein
MATLTAARAASTFPVAKTVGGGVLHAAYGTYTLAANPTVADIIQFCRVPAGSVVLGGWFMGADIDTGTETLDIDIGWAANGVESADPDGFGNFGVLSGDTITELIPVAGIYRPLQGVLLTGGPVTFSAETIIQGVVNAVAAGGGTGALTVVVLYVNP